jgi:hypothetical protein
VDLAASFVADEQPLEVVQPGEGALDDPAVAAESGAVLGLAASDHRLNAVVSDESTVFVVVVAPVGDHAVGTATRRARPAGHRRHCLQERDQLGDVVAVAARDRAGERDPARVDEQVVLGAVSGSINRARARLGAPFFACTWLESATARDHSISPAARKRESSTACSLSHTPDRCHSSRRRQQVTPEPKPSSGGRCVQAIPVCNTNKIPCNANRSSRRLRPGYRNRRSLLGNSGSNSSQSSSDTVHGATAIGTPSSLTTDADGLRRQETGPFIQK